MKDVTKYKIVDSATGNTIADNLSWAQAKALGHALSAKGNLGWQVARDHAATDFALQSA